jgi:hypothetical protein
MRFSNRVFLTIFSSAILPLLNGCVSSPTPRNELVNLPQLDALMSRVYVTAGTGTAGIKLWSIHQVGPVFFNDLHIGDTAKNEYIVVDLQPGTYETSCAPSDPEKNFPEKRNFIFLSGHTYYLACDMENNAGMAFGLAGYLVSNYVSKTFLDEKSGPDPEDKVVSYKSLDLRPIGENQTNTGSKPMSTSPASEKVYGQSLLPRQDAKSSVPSDLLTEKLRELQRLHDEKLITDDDYKKKKNQLLEAY